MPSRVNNTSSESPPGEKGDKKTSEKKTGKKDDKKNEKAEKKNKKDKKTKKKKTGKDDEDDDDELPDADNKPVGKGRDGDEDDDEDDIFGDLQGLDDLMGDGDENEEQQTKKRPAAQRHGSMKKPGTKKGEDPEACYADVVLQNIWKNTNIKPSCFFFFMFCPPWIKRFQVEKPMPFEYMIEKKDELKTDEMKPAEMKPYEEYRPLISRYIMCSSICPTLALETETL